LDRAHDRSSGAPDARWGTADGAVVAQAQGGGILANGTVWLRALGDHLAVDSSTTAPAYHANRAGVTAGADWNVENDTVAGVALGFDRDTLSENGGSSGNIGSFRVAAYASHSEGPLSMDAAFSGATDTIHARRVVTGIATSNHDATEFNGAFRFNYAVALDMATLTPNAGVNFSLLKDDNIAENGAGAFDLTASSRTTTSVRPFVGAKLGTTIQGDEGLVFTPDAHVAYSVETNDARRNMTVTTASGFDFPVVGVAPNKGMFNVGAGVQVQAVENISFYADYDASLSSNVTLQNVSLGLRYKF
jgi:outer membrane autotransporter protein